MLGSQLALTATREGTTLRLSLAGDFDRGGTHRLEQTFEKALEAPTERVVLDLSAVTFLDLGAIRTLLKVHARARSYGVDVSVVRPRGTARRIFTLTRVGDALPLAAPAPDATPGSGRTTATPIVPS